MSVELRPLGEVCKTTSGGTPSRSRPHYFEGTIPWVKSGELPDGIVIQNSEYISDEAISNSSAKLLPAGTLLVALYGATVGKLGILSRPAATNQAVCAIFPSEAIDTKFLFWYLLAKRPWLIGQAAGGAQPNISQGVVRSLMVPVMPLQAQREIVAELEKQFSRLDEAVANLQRVKANLKRYKASALKDAVEGRLVPTEAELARREGRNFETGEQLLQRVLAMRRGQWKAKGKYKEPPPVELPMLQEVPDGWTWCGIEHVSVSDKNALKAGPFGSALKKEFYVETGYKIYGQEQVIRGDANYGDYFIDGEKFRELESCAVKPGDVLVSLVGTAGKVLVLPADAAPGIINPRLIKLSLNLAVVLPEYVAYVLQSPVASRFFKAQAHGGTMDILNLGIVKSLPMPFPPIGEQRRIVDEVDRRHSLIRGVEAEVDANLKRAQSLRQATLQAAFSASTVSPVTAKRTEKCEESLHVST